MNAFTIPINTNLQVPYTKPTRIININDHHSHDQPFSLPKFTGFPPNGTDLNRGFSSKFAELRDQHDNTRDFHELLIALGRLHHHVRNDIVTYRNNLNKLMDLHWNKKRAFQIHGYRHLDGTIFLKPEERTDSKEPQQLLNMYHGFRFELDSTDGASTFEELQKTSQASVFSAKMKDLRLVIGAEIDCSYKNGIMELKTHMFGKDYSFRRYKARTAWIQSYLVGCPFVGVGFRDTNGILKESHLFTLDQLYNLRVEWDPSISLSTTYHVLKGLQSQIPPTGQYFLVDYPGNGTHLNVSSGLPNKFHFMKPDLLQRWDEVQKWKKSNTERSK